MSVPSELQEVVDNARVATGSSMVILTYYERSSDLVRVIAISGLGAEFAQNALAIIKKTVPDFDPLAISSRGDVNPASTAVYHRGQIVSTRFSDFAGGIVHPYVISLAGTLVAMREACMVPIRAGDQVAGSITFVGPAPFEEVAQRTCESFGRQIGLGWERERLLERLEGQVKELEASRMLIVSAEERVRRDVAGMLHGSVQTQLLVAWHRLGLCAELIQRDPQGALELLLQVREQVDRIREVDIREASHRLHPGILDVGLLPAVRSLADRFAGVFEVEVIAGEEIKRFDSPGDNVVGADLRFAAYRVIEEALGNVAKHAEARHAWVAVEAGGGHLEVTVSNDGKGIDTKSIRSGLGLRAMAQHVGAMGGTVHVGNRAGGGVEVVSRFPFDPEAGGAGPTAVPGVLKAPLG